MKWFKKKEPNNLIPQGWRDGSRIPFPCAPVLVKTVEGEYFVALHDGENYYYAHEDSYSTGKLLMGCLDQKVEMWMLLHGVIFDWSKDT